MIPEFILTHSKQQLGIACFDSNNFGIDLYNYSSGREAVPPPSPQIFREIHDCSFKNNHYFGIKMINSSPNVGTCNFHETNKIGFKIEDNSNLNIAYNANIQMMDSLAHFAFAPSSNEYLSSTIFAKDGHNDFYQTNWDLIFLDYNGIGIEMDFNGNWWEDNELNSLFQNSPNEPLLLWSDMDDNPNVTVISPAVADRFLEATFSEANNEPGLALAQFKQILLERLDNEQKNWASCVDRTYELSVILKRDLNLLMTFYEELYADVPNYLNEEEYKKFRTVLDIYIQKCYVQLKEYQNAANKVIGNIDSASTEIEKIYALMWLESIYQLSSTDNGRASISTKYDNLCANNINDFMKNMRKYQKRLDLLSETTSNNVSVPTKFAMRNYPNPFNPTTTIAFDLPKDSKVKIEIFNIKGQKVKTLVNDKYQKGIHSVIWNGKNESEKNVGTGVYFYKLDLNGKTTAIKKCLMLK